MARTAALDRAEAARMTAQLVRLEIALDEFLTGEMMTDTITPFSMTLLVSARSLQAISERARRTITDRPPQLKTARLGTISALISDTTDTER